MPKDESNLPSRELGERELSIAAKARVDLASAVSLVAAFASRLADHKTWPLQALAVGTIPLLASFLFVLPGHAIVSAVLLALISIGFAANDRWMRCLLAITLSFVSHSVLAVAISRQAPETCAKIMPHAADYWDAQHRWITTGENEEYELASWLPAHLRMFVGITFFSFSSFGTVVFHDGFIQVDMMNYYNAQLQTISDNHVRAMGFGWHIWSIMRGIGYLFVTYEMISLAVQFFSRTEIAKWRTRGIRLSIGLGFLIADCVIKYFAVDAVRSQLLQNLV